MSLLPGLRLKCVIKNYFCYFSTKTYGVDTQKNYLNETVLLSIHKHMFKLMNKKIFTIFGYKIPLSGPLIRTVLNFGVNKEISAQVLGFTKKAS